MVGDSSNVIWGVMDVHPRTNFPDIRKKVFINSAAGSLVIIPREGRSLVRFYVEFPSGQRAQDVTLEGLHGMARDIFAPYEMEIAATVWWSAYSIGQRLADRFGHHDRVFLAGDACHTHSPKAGQGMNVSLQDGYNIGWKLASVLKGEAHPAIVSTYVLERSKVASDLIDFDRYWTKLFAKGADGKSTASPEEFSEGFVKSLKYTAGLTATYDDSVITAAGASQQDLATGLTVGMRFPSAAVTRFCDARPMQLAQALPADGRWRLVVFAGDLRDRTRAGKLDAVSPRALRSLSHDANGHSLQSTCVLSEGLPCASRSPVTTLMRSSSQSWSCTASAHRSSRSRSTTTSGRRRASGGAEVRVSIGTRA